MGLFNFSKYNDIEKALLDQYTQMMSMMGISSAEAKKMAGDMLDQAIEESKKRRNILSASKFRRYYFW